MATNEITTLEIGGRNSVKELADRIKLMMPNATKFTTSEALAVAQVALMNALDPFNGEVWGIKSDKTGEWKGVMVGVKGLRKAGNRQAKMEDTVYWIDLVLVASDKYGATKPGSMVYEAHLRDTVKVQAWGKSLNILTTAGVPYPEAVKMLGACPEVVGIGIADPSEYSKMGLGQRAKKRAEADALKQRFQVSFGAGVIAEGDKMDDETAAIAEGTDIINATATDIIPDENAGKSENILLNELGFDGVAEPEFEPSDALDEAPAMSKEEAEYLDACEMISTSTGQRYGDIDDVKLNFVVNSKAQGATPEKKLAASRVLAWRAAHPSA